MPVKEQADMGIQTQVIAASETASGIFEVGDYRRALIRLPGTMTGTTFAIHACDTREGTFVVVEGTDGNALSMSFAVSTWMAVPDAALSAKYIKFVSGSTETSERSLTLMLKS